MPPSLLVLYSHLPKKNHSQGTHTPEFSKQSAPPWGPSSPEEANMLRCVLHQLEGKVANAPTSSLRLADSLDIIRDVMQRIRDMLSPVRRLHLPHGILALIFHFFVHEGESFDSRSKALILCSVSRRWRKVALSTPALWTNLVLNIKPGWNLIFERTCLSRSYPYSVNIQLSADQECLPVWLDEAIALISKYMCRIQYLAIDIQPPAIDDQIFNRRLGGVFPAFRVEATANRLTTLTVSVPPGALAWEWISSLCGIAPRLSGLCFFGDTLPNAPWSQLTRLAIRPIDLFESLRILAHAPRLRDVDLTIGATEPIAHSPRLLVHNLKCLLLERHEGANIPVINFLSYVQLPHLVSLAIVGETNDFLPFPLLSLFHRSSCHLRRFIVVDTPILAKHFRTILEHAAMQRLKWLKIERSIAGDFSHRLLYDLAGPCPSLLPTLEVVYVDPMPSARGPVVFFAKRKDGLYSYHAPTTGTPSLGDVFTFDPSDSCWRIFELARIYIWPAIGHSINSLLNTKGSACPARIRIPHWTELAN
ncbi:hypothetical protein R3P38DRAFT_3360441 [Favolaschia claudopus]|uniref:F-box domain-containing protein n=1 Tax=Favolaschia claudopus TaxID=2862362 RepID=A0AAW0AY49_9AGAR